MKYASLILTMMCSAGAWSATAATSAPAPASPKGDAQATQPDSALKARYPDKATFLAEVKKAASSFAVELDGKPVTPGFGPAIAYRTQRDGSISK